MATCKPCRLYEMPTTNTGWRSALASLQQQLRGDNWRCYNGCGSMSILGTSRPASQRPAVTSWGSYAGPGNSNHLAHGGAHFHLLPNCCCVAVVQK